MSVDEGRNRIERRIVTVFEPSNKLAGSDWEDHVKTVIRAERDVFNCGPADGSSRHSTETAFYLASQPLAAKIAANAVRAHWGVETTSHYSRDVTMGEDRSRIRSNPGIFARVRSFAFNILKANRSGTLPQDRYRAALAGLPPLLRLLKIRQR
jgi:hypothetical protein